MPTNTYKVSFIFNAGKAGWSENWYLDASDAFSARTVGRSVAQLRANLLGQEATLEAVRVSDVNIVGDSLVSLSGWTTQLQLTSPIRDQAASAIFVRCESGPLYRRQVWLRAPPDAWIAFTSGDAEIVDGGALVNFNLWKDAMVTALFELKVISKDPADMKTVKITDVIAGAGVTTIVCPGHSLALLDSVRLSGIKFGPLPAPSDIAFQRAINKVWTVFNPQIDRFDVRIVDSAIKPYLGTGGQVSKRVVRYVPITTMQWERFGTRKIGRPFFLPRGRRRTPR